MIADNLAAADRPPWRLPLEQNASAALGRLGLSGLRIAFGVAAMPEVSGDAAALSVWISSPAVAAASLRRAEAAMLSRDLVLEDPIHRLQLASAMDGGHGAATGIAARRLPGAEMLLPPHLIGAFRSPLFRRESLALIRRHLETRVLFHPDGPPLVVLSVPTCLALAAFVASPPKAVAAQLKIAARAACATNGWAGFWDQWVIGRAGAATGEPFPPEMQGLPLVVLGQAALDPDHGTTDARCTAEWARKAPVWALSLLGGQP